MSSRRSRTGIAVLVGVPLGLTCGLLPPFEHATRPPFHFLRMISPLSWAPVAVALFGIGHQPVYFLIAIAAVWPITLNTIAGGAHDRAGLPRRGPSGS